MRLHRVVLGIAIVGALILTSSCRHASDPVASPQARLRYFGVATDPWHLDDWGDAVGATPNMIMEFESWNRNRTLDSHFEEARKQGMLAFMITWEPWAPADATSGSGAGAPQPEYTNAAIAAGSQDAYLRMFARSVARTELPVYLRYAHEMNGDWYPWSMDPAGYVAAWRHVVEVFRQEKAVNVTFVFSVNPSLYLGSTELMASVMPYWPGDDYVDYVGATMINFGGIKNYTVARFADRLQLIHATFHKELFITELNTAAEVRVAWLADLRSWLSTEATWVKGAVLSQGESRGKAELGDRVGNLSWNAMTDPDTRPIIKRIVNDLTNPPPTGPGT